MQVMTVSSGAEVDGKVLEVKSLVKMKVYKVICDRIPHQKIYDNYV